MATTLDFPGLMAEIQSVAAAVPQLSARDVVKYLDARIALASLSGGISSYTINGRTVTRSVSELESLLKIAMARMNREEYGQISQQPIAFRPVI